MNLVIITSRYPKENQPYNHMFVHVRALYFKSKGVNVQIIVPEKEKLSYNYQGIDVLEIPTKEILALLPNYDVLYLHLLNQYPLKNGGLLIYKEIMNRKYKTAMYIHGSDVLIYHDHLYDFEWSFKGVAKYLYVNYWSHYILKRFLNKISETDKYLLLTPSKWMKNKTEEIFGRKFDKFQVLPNGIDTELFDVPFNYENRYKLVTIRPLSDPKYGVDMAIDLMRLLPEKFTLDIYGKGHLNAKFEQMIVEYGLEHRVKIIEDFIDREKIPQLFSNYGLFCAFTRFDSQGVIMCEAMSSRLLTISNDNSAITEFIMNNTGGLVENDLQMLAKKIDQVVDDLEGMKKIVETGRALMENINWKIQGEKELTLLKTLRDEN